MILRPSPPLGVPPQRQTSRGLGAFLSVNLDRDAVAHQTAPRHRAGVEQECEYTGRCLKKKKKITVISFENVAVKQQFATVVVFSLGSHWQPGCFLACGLTAIAHYFASTSIFSDGALKLHESLPRA